MTDDPNSMFIATLLSNEESGLEIIRSDLRESVKTIARIDPFVALELRIAVGGNPLTSIFDSNGSHGDRRLKLETQLKVFELLSMYLEQTLRKTLWKVDKILFMKFYFHNRKEKKSSVIPYEGWFSKR